MTTVYRICRKCGKEWNVSRKDPGDKTYICHTCEYKQRLQNRPKENKKAR